MGGGADALGAHLESGDTTLCHAWAILRRDGTRFAFTDHDRDLSFEGFDFRADSGLSAKAIAQSTGLAVDNSEALGALSDAAIREDEIEQGRFDGAEVLAWLVNWANVAERRLQFRGSIGELQRADGVFRAELRGLTEALNRPLGRVYQKPCTAVLGDGNCRFDPAAEGYSTSLEVVEEADRRRFIWPALEGFAPGWFTRGRLDVLEGPAQGLWSIIKHDRVKDGARLIELWEPVRGAVGPGTRVRLTAGCDRRFETCRVKFDNLVNFQGFPDLPGEDWVMAVPKRTGTNGGGSLR
ncbi:MAG: DUF2163 domain-containing protein [Sulfitobacter sp.]|nr:DUF2163 domain-containing protein [Sulfitobacter sp.]